MQSFSFLLLLCGLFSCRDKGVPSQLSLPEVVPSFVQKQVADKRSWAYFLQHLPEKKGAVVDYRGRAIADQQKHVAIINYDVGTRDLQQCADALIRLRAEYLFNEKRYAEIGFRFTSGHLYTYLDYCSGSRPLPNGNSVRFTTAPAAAISPRSLRQYLDIVYTYAGTISLAGELKPVSEPAIGTVIITPGSPGHCLIVTNEAIALSGEKVFKLVEGYTPAQSIYVLRNIAKPALGCWHRLSRKAIETASYTFHSYQLKSFE